MISRFRIFKDRNRALRTKADSARDARDWPLAAALYEVYLADSASDRDAPIWLQLGHARKESGDNAGALQAYRRSLEMAPHVAETHLQIGHLHNKTGAHEDAVASYKQAARLDQTSGDADHELARFGSALPAQDDAELLLARADSARDRGHWSEAVGFYTQRLHALQGRVDDWPLWVQLGHARKEAGDNDGAVQAYEQAIELAPDHLETHLHLAHLNKRMGAIQAAIASFAQVLRLDPDNAEAAQQLGALQIQNAQERLGQIETKVNQGVRFALPLPHLQEQITFDPDIPNVYCGLSRRFAASAGSDAAGC